VKILVTGRGTSGSWKIRGEQLGRAIGAHVEPQALRYDSELVIGVKRVSSVLAEAYRGRLVWDVVDAWPQPTGNDWGEADCKAWLRSEIERLQPIGLIAATRKMAEDCQGFDIPVLWLPHHCRPGIEPNPIRDRVEVIGYEGGVKYIEPWLQTVESECRRIGARFVLNPPRLADLDIVLALRGASGYAPRFWKSNVKASNAHGSGTPLIACRESGYLELATGLEQWADTPEELTAAIDALADVEKRRRVREVFLQAAIPLEVAAERLRNWLGDL
jgi:hypothetical protein